ncbi:hypothetical protein ACFX19_004989 [Malus domestica]
MGSELIFRGHKPTNMRRHPDLHPPPPTLLTSSTPCSPYASGNVPISNYVRYDFDSSATTQYNERGHWGSNRKVPLGLKRKGLRIVVTGGAGSTICSRSTRSTIWLAEIRAHPTHDVVEPLLLEVHVVERWRWTAPSGWGGEGRMDVMWVQREKGGRRRRCSNEEEAAEVGWVD